MQKAIVPLFLFMTYLSSAQQATFRVKRPNVDAPCSQLIKFPLYQQKVNLPDTVNFLVLDSLPTANECLALWTDKAIITAFDVWINTNGELFRIGSYNDTQINEAVRWAFSKAVNVQNKVMVTITQIYANGKVGNAQWTYRVKFLGR